MAANLVRSKHKEMTVVKLHAWASRALNIRAFDSSAFSSQRYAQGEMVLVNRQPWTRRQPSDQATAIRAVSGRAVTSVFRCRASPSCIILASPIIAASRASIHPHLFVSPFSFAALILGRALVPSLPTI